MMNQDMGFEHLAIFGLLKRMQSSDCENGGPADCIMAVLRVGLFHKSQNQG